MKRLLLLLLTYGYFSNATAQVLPPELPWSGASEKYMRAANHPWVTPAEKSGLTETPDYQTTINWLQKLADSSPLLSMQPIGKSGQNRDLWLVAAAKPHIQKPEQLQKSDKATLLFHAGIHSGEIDGKDAGMMFLRDLVLEDSSVLDKINILFIPVLNPDGHENSSQFARVNQRGPVEMGWRTNARNLNLNRDYSKAETPEIQALLKVFQKWAVDLYIDIHVTDGIDYQYDITWGSTSKFPYSPNIDAWLKKELYPELQKALRKQGHVPGPLIFARDNKNPETSLVEWSPMARFSNGYGDSRHLPTILIENHSLKNYKQRVLGTYVFLQAVADRLAKDGKSLQNATMQDRSARPKKINLPPNWSADFSKIIPDTLDYLGVAYKKYQSPISGTEEVQWLGKPKNARVPIFSQAPEIQIELPKAYWVPASRSDIIEKLQLHGIKMEIVQKPTNVAAQFYRLEKYKVSGSAYEGRVRLAIDEMKIEEHEATFAPGSARITTDQALADLLVLLLEPRSDDSFIQWGYFHEILQPTEYIEAYVIEPLAQKMLKENPELRKEFEQALQDEKFAKNPRARLYWFYKRSPYYDKSYLLYPVGREM
ncbi:MAG: carboxypeptidase [Calditrichaeota bacterium]|nr:MAG: carboxypeptidase [Calditrichota bacterium]